MGGLNKEKQKVKMKFYIYISLAQNQKDINGTRNVLRAKWEKRKRKDIQHWFPFFNMALKHRYIELNPIEYFM